MSIVDSRRDVALRLSRSDSEVARWALIEGLLQEVLALPPESRAAYLDTSRVDISIRAEIEALVAAHERRGAVDELMDRVMTPLLAVGEPGPRRSGAIPQLPRYRIIERLGGGGMGIVYRARDERLERDVALKFLPPHLSTDQAAKKRFLVEARAAAALEHPNICTVHEIGDTDDGQLYIVMACYDGETLERRIARGPLAVGEALHIAVEIARGLAKAHERGIVHRDIKPSNIIITSDGLVKILDFGIAKLATASATQTVGIVGTLAYMSPEQAFGEAVDHRTDFWSLGVVLYEMLAGIRPFRGTGEQAALFNALADEPDPLGDLRPEAPPSVDPIIRRALAKRPADRFANAAELLGALMSSQSAIVPIATAASEAPMAPTDRDTALTRGGERRQVTMVACITSGCEELIDRLSPEVAERVISRIRDAAAEIATQHGGIVNHFLGDRFVLLFGVPTAHDDDALRAVRSALALHARVAEIGATLDTRSSTLLRLRSGIHVGAVVARRLREGDQRFRITGSSADIAIRLAAAADPDAILLTPEMRRLVEPFVHLTEARPISLQADAPAVVPLRAIGATDVRSRLERSARDGLTPFVGRERECAILVEHLVAAREGTGRLIVLIGEAGVGKSRMLHELRQAAVAQGTRVLIGRCDAFGSTTPFLPFVEAAQQALGIPGNGTVRERHDAVISATREIDPAIEEFIPLYLALLAIRSETHPVPAHLREELFQTAMLEAVAALFTLGALSRPTLLLLEDWHWADEASRAALRQLTEILPGFPLLVVVTARAYGSMDWGSADHQLLLHLAPLDATASAAIAGAALGADRVSPELGTRLHERTGGNPFFLEELCAALREQGVVSMHEGEATIAGDAGRVHVPETVQGVLRTRIDRLDGEARDALRVATVIGREFTRGVLEDVANRSGELGRAIERLKASGLVQQVGVVPEPSYRFKHVLTQEVAYDSLLEHQRTALHAAVGRAIERRYAASLDEQADCLSYHFSRAEVWPEAVRYGLRAADRAMALSQNTDALIILERVEQWVLRLPDDAARRDLHAEALLRQERLCEMLGLRNRQLGLMESLIALLAPFGPSERLSQAYLRQGDAFTLLRRFESADRALETALGMARERHDAAGERSALRSIALLRSYEGHHEQAIAHIERVLALGRASGDTRAVAGDLATLANMFRVTGQLERALAVLHEALECTTPQDNPVRYGALVHVVGSVYRELGDYDTALHWFRRVSVEGVDERHPVYASFTLPAIAHILFEQGRVEEALETYRRAVALNRKARHADGSAHCCRSLGEVLVGLGRDAEALPYLAEAARLFAQLEDGPNEALMRRRLAVVYEHLLRLDDALEEWTRVRVLDRANGNLAGEIEAVDGMARAERKLTRPVSDVIARYEEALALAKRFGDRKRELAVRNALGIVHWQRGAYSDAVRQYETALRLCRETADRVHEGLILNSLGATLQRQRRWDEARTTLLEAVRVSTDTGERQLHAHALAMLGDVCLASGRFEEALLDFEASLALRRELEDRAGESALLDRIARVNAARAAGTSANQP